jgi:hypothetical protein
VTSAGTSSPWEAALGERIDALDPALRGYFSAIPDGSVGRGSGVFDRVGTPRRWLWPVLALLGRAGIVFPVWAHDVPFDVVNTAEDGVVRAERTFHFARGDRVMRDEIGTTSGRIVDVLGARRRLRTPLDASVIDGRLELRSRGAALRIGRVWLTLPLAPRVRLIERRDGDRQRVELTMTMPLIGRIYEYTGSFRYRIEER